MTTARPYKVWSCDRQVRKAVLAYSLQDLRDRGCEKLGFFPEDISIVLESDGTEVEEETYFKTLEIDTVFLFLRPGEGWLPPGVEALRAVGRDVADGPSSMSRTHRQLSKDIVDPERLLNLLRQDYSNMLVFTDEQLQIVSDADTSTFAIDRDDERFLDAAQEACLRRLDQQEDSREAMALLRLWTQRNHIGDSVDSGSSVQNTNTSDEIISQLSNVRNWQRVHYQNQDLSVTKMENKK